MDESWKNIPGFSRYEISDGGYVRIAGTTRVMKQRFRGSLGFGLNLFRDGEEERQTWMPAHRLHASAWDAPCDSPVFLRQKSGPPKTKPDYERKVHAERDGAPACGTGTAWSHAFIVEPRPQNVAVSCKACRGVVGKAFAGARCKLVAVAAFTEEWLRQAYSVNAETGCWDWNFRLCVYGYGRFEHDGRYGYAAHRAFYERFVGPIGDGLCVCHRCDRRNCVNPAHLFLGTIAENTADMIAKGRQYKGGRPAHARLSDGLVRAIRARVAAGDTVTELAIALGFTRACVSHAASGKTWEHVRPVDSSLLTREDAELMVSVLRWQRERNPAVATRCDELAERIRGTA